MSSQFIATINLIKSYLNFHIIEDLNNSQNDLYYLYPRYFEVQVGSNRVTNGAGPHLDSIYAARWVSLRDEAH
ncbi:hypothetical protein BF17_00730 [Yersinia similis]|uniref:Uncharacterized protein n=1 Tax=Yersinia similis TaxID=367190 RepID=A0ABN4CVD5_9GAMM|nr:hypothetical protein BF17_00730 [Yersinia similis]